MQNFLSYLFEVSVYSYFLSNVLPYNLTLIAS
jgi:hypothetical protein